MQLTPAQRACLQDIKEYFEQRQDIRDGSYGEQLPNEEMSLLSQMEEVGLI